LELWLWEFYTILACFKFSVLMLLIELILWLNHLELEWGHKLKNSFMQHQFNISFKSVIFQHDNNYIFVTQHLLDDIDFSSKILRWKNLDNPDVDSDHLGVYSDRSEQTWDSFDVRRWKVTKTLLLKKIKRIKNWPPGFNIFHSFELWWMVS